MVFQLAGCLLLCVAIGSVTQAGTAITQTTGAGDLGTQVLPPSGNLYGITGGKPVGNNLYHSFGQFSVGTGDVAQFQTSTLLPNSTLSNILARVTGPNPSSIFGTIDSISYYPSANLFLMNPNGILFGPGAQIFVGGIAHFTTADYLRLSDGVRFEALPGAQDALLSTASVAAFGFLGSNPAAIMVQGSQLTMGKRTGLSLVGGNRGFTYTNPDTGAKASVPDGVTMTGGRLSAPSGQINLVSVASKGEISAGDFMPTSGMKMGNIALSQGAILDVSGDGGGTVRIRGGQFIMDQAAAVRANTTGASNGAPTAISVNVTEKIVLLGGSSILSVAEGEGNGGLVSLTAPSIEMHGNSNITTSSTGLGDAGYIELQGNQVNLTTVSFVKARTESKGHGGNITIRGLTGKGSRANDVRLSDNSQLVSETIGQLLGEGDAGNILVETARLNLSGGSLFNTASRGSTGAAGNITVNATDSLTISGHGTQLTSASMEFSFGDAGHISISAPSVVIENNGFISTSTGLMKNAGTITVNTNNLQLLSGGHITSSSLLENPGYPPSGAAGNVTIQGLASPAQSVLIDGPGSGIFTDTQGTGAGGNILVKANSVTLQNSGTLSASSTGLVEHPGNAGNIEINATNGLTMQNSAITTQAGQGAGGGNIKVTTSRAATVRLQNSKISASVADGPGGGGNISIDPQFVILQHSQILAQAAQGQGGAITIIASLFLPDAISIVNADSGSGVNGTVTIQSPNAPASGKIQPLGKSPLQATSLLNQRCASLAGGEFSSFTVTGRDSLPTEPGSWLASPLALGPAGFSAGSVTEGGEQARVIDLAQETTALSLRQIAPAGFLTQAFAVDESTGCQS
jgi:filamentous hemagglutinin family protein